MGVEGGVVARHLNLEIIEKKTQSKKEKGGSSFFGS